jgi:hypothetical protein
VVHAPGATGAAAPKMGLGLFTRFSQRQRVRINPLSLSVPQNILDQWAREVPSSGRDGLGRTSSRSGGAHTLADLTVDDLMQVNPRHRTDIRTQHPLSSVLAPLAQTPSSRCSCRNPPSLSHDGSPGSESAVLTPCAIRYPRPSSSNFTAAGGE